MGFLDDVYGFLGYGEDFWSGTPTEVTQTPTLLPSQTKFVDWLSGYAMNQAQSAMGGMGAYPYQMTAPMSPLESQAQNTAVMNIPTLQRMLDPASNMDYWNTAFEPAQEAIANRFAAVNGSRSSGMMEALGRGYGQQIIPQVMQQQQFAAQQLPQTAAMQSYIGSIPRSIQNQLSQEGYQKWLYSQPYNNPWNQLGLQASGIQTQQPTVLQGSPGFFSQLAGSAGQALPFLFM